MAERYVTDSLEAYPIGACPACASTIGHADLTRCEDWSKFVSSDVEIPLLWIAEGPLKCSICGHQRQVKADVHSGSVKPVFESMSAA